MTNIVIWQQHNGGDIWTIADTRITDPSKLSDQASKILTLEVATHRAVLDLGFQAYWSLNIGYCYAGAVFPAIMAHSALSVILRNLKISDERLPSLEKIADIISFIVESYVREASKAHSFEKPPHCQIAIFGLSGFDGKPAAYLIGPQNLYPDFKYIYRLLDLENGPVVIGDDTVKLKNEIDLLIAAADPVHKGMEAKIALEMRIKENKNRTVGGTLQYGVLKGNSIITYAVNASEEKQYFLGFDLERDIAKRLGFDVILASIS
jgi:hypothetical protein